MEADSVCAAWIASGIEKFFSAGSVGGILRDVGCVGPMIGWKDAVGYAGLAVEQEFYQCFAVGDEG